MYMCTCTVHVYTTWKQGGGEGREGDGGGEGERGDEMGEGEGEKDEGTERVEGEGEGRGGGRGSVKEVSGAAVTISYTANEGHRPGMLIQQWR